MVSGTDGLNLVSAGGIQMTLPARWRPVGASEHLGAFCDPTDVVAGFAPTLVLHTSPGHLSPTFWWGTTALELEGAMLLAVDRGPGEGFTAEYAHRYGPHSLTCHASVRYLPGRSLVATLSTSSAGADLRDVAAEIFTSITLEGLP